jgi:hypothetical protein
MGDVEAEEFHGEEIRNPKSEIRNKFKRGNREWRKLSGELKNKGMGDVEAEEFHGAGLVQSSKSKVQGSESGTRYLVRYN